MKHDIENIEDIKLMVNQFYDSIRKDDLLGVIFNTIIQDRWSKHLDKMYRFWQTVLLDEHTYAGSPFLPHASMHLQQHHFDRWVGLFDKTVDEHFIGPKADRAKWQGHRMAELFLSKIEYYRENSARPLI